MEPSECGQPGGLSSLRVDADADDSREMRHSTCWHEVHGGLAARQPILGACSALALAGAEQAPTPNKWFSDLHPSTEGAGGHDVDRWTDERPVAPQEGHDERSKATSGKERDSDHHPSY